MAHICGFIAEPLNLIHRRLAGVERHHGDDPKEVREPGRFGVVAQAKPRVHENGAFIRFDEQAQGPRFHFGRKTGIAGETVEKMNGHALI